MYVCLFENPRCVWIRIPKTGTTSIRNAFFGACAKERRFSSIPIEWKPIKSFTVVRHPYARLASVLSMFKTHRAAKSPEELEFKNTLSIQKIIRIVDDPNIKPAMHPYFCRLKSHALPLTSELIGINDAEQIFKFEHFDLTWFGIAEYLAVREPELIHEKINHDRIELTTNDKRLIADYYRRDFEEFGYDF